MANARTDMLIAENIFMGNFLHYRVCNAGAGRIARARFI
jgi:hypothetical protein